MKNGDINIEWGVEEGTNTSLDTIYKWVQMYGSDNASLSF
jgi:hypothetical protein